MRGRPSASDGIAQAMEALEAFCRQHHLWAELRLYADGKGSCVIRNDWMSLGEQYDLPLPQSICLAIVAAAEAARTPDAGKEQG